MRGVTLRELQELLGHSSLAMTMRYAHLAPEHLRTAVSRLEGLTSVEPTKACRPVRSQGLTCPHCERQSTDIEFVDRSADERTSFFVRPACSRAFGHQH